MAEGSQVPPSSPGLLPSRIVFPNKTIKFNYDFSWFFSYKPRCLRKGLCIGGRKNYNFALCSKKCVKYKRRKNLTHGTNNLLLSITTAKMNIWKKYTILLVEYWTRALNKDPNFRIRHRYITSGSVSLYQYGYKDQSCGCGFNIEIFEIYLTGSGFAILVRTMK